MKKIMWHVVDHNGRRVYGHAGLRTRKQARDFKTDLNQEIFAEWNNDIEYPLHIEREEWLLVSNKVVA